MLGDARAPRSVPGSSASDCTREQAGNMYASHGASPNHRKTRHCLLLPQQQSFSRSHPHTPSERTMGGRKGRGIIAHRCRYLRETFWGKMQTVQQGLNNNNKKRQKKKRN